MRTTPPPPTPAPPPPAAPEHLSETSHRLWAWLVPERCASPERCALLTVALEALDRAERARLALAAEGMTSTSGTGVLHVHPLVRVERDAHATFLRAGALRGFAG